MKKLAFGILAIASLVLAMSFDNCFVQLVLMVCFLGSLQQTGVVNYMDEINKEY